jgi:FkbM family methyltransferase
LSTGDPYRLEGDALSMSIDLAHKLFDAEKMSLLQFSRKPKPKSDEGKLALLLEQHEISSVLDVGANVGQTGKRLRDLGYRGRILSFEPVQATHQKLLTTAKGDSRWEVMPPMALGDHEGITEINVTAASDMSSLATPNQTLTVSLPNARVVYRETISVKRLDEIWHLVHRPGDKTLLKLDTQGSELPILEGGASCMAEISAILIELSLVPLYDGEGDYLRICQRIADFGFKPALFIPGYFSRRQARLLQMDGFFVR